MATICSTDAGPCLPPGFRFHPTDEELVTYYLGKKFENSEFKDRAISEVDLNTSEPWELPLKATMGEKEWYFFSLKDRKYPTGTRSNRATKCGYWKATGKDREVMSAAGVNSPYSRQVGIKKTLVFYRGRAPKGLRTNWVMHEYRSSIQPTRKKEWVLCRIFHKSAGGNKLGLAELAGADRCAATPVAASLQVLPDTHELRSFLHHYTSNVMVDIKHLDIIMQQCQQPSASGTDVYGVKQTSSPNAVDNNYLSPTGVHGWTLSECHAAMDFGHHSRPCDAVAVEDLDPVVIDDTLTTMPPLFEQSPCFQSDFEWISTHLIS